MKKIDLTNQTFHYLVVKSELEPKISKSGHKTCMWLCQCICGNEIQARVSQLVSKIQPIESCGCKSFTKLHGNRQHDNPQICSWNGLIKRYKNALKKKSKSLDWLLSDKEAIELFKGVCFYCKIEPQNIYNVYVTKEGKYATKNLEWANRAYIHFNGIDRVNSDLGYTIENTVSCCKICNFAKNDLSIEEFYTWIARISKVFNEKNSSHI